MDVKQALARERGSGPTAARILIFCDSIRHYEFDEVWVETDAAYDAFGHGRRGLSRPSDVRLYAILARNAARAILFRRGPSKRVLLILWNMENDTFDEGQWL